MLGCLPPSSTSTSTVDGMLQEGLRGSLSPQKVDLGADGTVVVSGHHLGGSPCFVVANGQEADFVV